MNKGGTVLLAQNKDDRLWLCPSFEFADGDDPKDVLIQGMKKTLGIDIKTDGIVYEHETEKGKKIFVNVVEFSGKITNSGFADVGWFDAELLESVDIMVDSKFAVLKSETQIQS